MDTARNLRADAFAGTAEAYLRWRPPYPEPLLRELLARAALPPAPILVDLACGPGRAALDLAPSFARVLAVDLEPEMVAAGEAEAKRRGLGAVEWRIGRAEDLELAEASVDLVTVGDAIHRLDQDVVLARVRRWLKPGGSLAVLGSDGLFGGGARWKEALAAVVRRWTARAFPAGVPAGLPGAAVTPDAIARRLADAGFSPVERREVTEPWTWSVDAVLGWLGSTSVCSAQALGDDAPAFEADLVQALGGKGGVFHDTLGFGYILGRNP